VGEGQIASPLAHASVPRVRGDTMDMLRSCNNTCIGYSDWALSLVIPYNTGCGSWPDDTNYARRRVAGGRNRHAPYVRPSVRASVTYASPPTGPLAHRARRRAASVVARSGQVEHEIATLRIHCSTPPKDDASTVYGKAAYRQGGAKHSVIDRRE